MIASFAKTEEKYLEILRSMSPEQKLLKAIELTEESRELFLAGLRSRHPSSSEGEIRRMAASQLLQWRSSTS